VGDFELPEMHNRDAVRGSIEFEKAGSFHVETFSLTLSIASKGQIGGSSDFFRACTG
jgi:hypothetical protein